MPGSEQRHEPGIEHALPEYYPHPVPVCHLLPGATPVPDPESDDLRAQSFADVAEAYEAVRALPASARPAPSPPARLYLDDAAWKAGCESRRVRRLKQSPVPPPGAMPRFRRPGAFADFVREQL